MIRIESLPADVLPLTPLARAAIAGKLDPTLVPVPRSLRAMERPEDRFEARERDALATTLEKHVAPLAPHVAVLDAIRSLRAPHAFAIVAGQQPGLFASPLYSLYKALQSIALARELSAQWGTPVVALFWNHADDHDVAEVHHAHFVNANLDLQRVGLAGLASGKQPLSRVVFDDEAHRLASARALVAQLVASRPFAERAMEVFAPRHAETFARAFTRAFTSLLGPLGLVVVEPDWIREGLSRALVRIVERDPAAKLAQGAELVKQSGFEVSIEPDGAALLFHLGPEGRRALRAGGDGFRYDGESGSRTASELAAEIVVEPLSWSPGALLRPIAQDLVLPVAAYIGGFGELAYHAELGPLRDSVNAARTWFVPRISMTLVDPECDLALTKLETTLAEVLAARGSFAAAASAIPPPEVLAKMRVIASVADRALVALKSELAELDPVLALQLKKTGDQIEALVDKLAEKAERIHQNKSGKGKRHERRANNMLYPGGEPQERVLGPLAFVARFGEDWIAELAREIDPLAPEHLAVHLTSVDDAESNPEGEMT